jgi:hypothetical protein
MTIDQNQSKIDPRLIGDHVCTTVHHSLAAYDRIIVHGSQLNNLVPILCISVSA